jgi:hypothetical protein
MDSPRQSILPPLPPSDSKSLEWNRYDSYYKYKARDFWGEAEVVREEPKPFEKCEHQFKAIQGGVRCKKCHFGLHGFIEISNGKLAFKGKTLEI